MKITQTYDEAKDKLITLYHQLSESNLSTGVDSIPENIFQLDNQQFILSICGEIKTGKSTLINYLLFDGDEVLPIDAIPETARLTRILYGEEEKAVVHFLDQNAWNEVERQFKGNPDSKNEWEEVGIKLNNLAKQGVYLQGIVKNKQYSKTIKIEDLGKYISKESDYVPMVGSAEVFKNHPMLSKVIVVDTPGLNDPCISRSKVTEGWISRTDALIYLLRSTQPLTEQDMKFLDKYCSHLNPAKLILAVTKIDQVTASFDDIVEYINSVLNDEKYKRRNYFQNRQPLAISVISAMLKNCPDKVKYKDEYREKIPPDLIQKEGWLPDFIKAISDSLMQSKGSDIIDSHKGKIKSILRLNIEVIELDKNSLTDRRDNCGKSEKEMQEKKKQAEKLNRDMTSMDENLKKEKRDLKKVIKDETKKHFDDAWHGTISVLEDLITREDFGYWKSNIQPKIIKCASKDIKNFCDGLETNTEITSKIDSLNDRIREFHHECERQMPDLVTFRSSIHLPEPSYSNTTKKLKSLVYDILSSNELEKTRARFLGFLWTMEKKSKGKLLVMITETLVEVYDEIIKSLCNSILGEINDEICSFTTDMTNVLKEMKNNLDNIRSKVDERKKEIDEINNEIGLKTIELSRLNALKTEIDSKLSIIVAGE